MYNEIENQNTEFENILKDNNTINENVVNNAEKYQNSLDNTNTNTNTTNTNTTNSNVVTNSTTNTTPANTENVVVVDLSWYAPYKSYGDLIITGFVYLMFLWRLFIKLPNIISGTGGDINNWMEVIKK